MGVFDMLTEHMVVRIRLIVYVVLIIFSFFIFIGVAVMKDKSSNNCPLYFTRPVSLGPVSNCNYPLAIAIIFQLIYTLYRVVILLLLVLGKFTTEMFLFSNIVELVYVLIDVAVFMLTFIGACILSAGHNSSEWGNNDWKSASSVAQAGAWISTILWLLLAIVGVVYMLRAGKLPFLKSGSGGAAGSGNTGNTGPSAPPIDTPPNYDQSKY